MPAGTLSSPQASQLAVVQRRGKQGVAGIAWPTREPGYEQSLNRGVAGGEVSEPLRDESAPGSWGVGASRGDTSPRSPRSGYSRL